MTVELNLILFSSKDQDISSHLSEPNKIISVNHRSRKKMRIQSDCESVMSLL